MNLVLQMGRLVKDPEIRYGASGSAVASYRIAVDRSYHRDGEPSADFFDCVAFGKVAEFVEKYLHKGSKIIVNGELRNNDYTNKDGQTIRRNVIHVHSHEFAESRSNNAGGAAQAAPTAAPEQPYDGGFMDIPDMDDEELPFN